MAGEIIKLYEKETSRKQLQRIADILDRGAVMIFPTDTSYSLGCSLNSPKSIAKLKKIKGSEEDNLTIICDGLSMITEYARVDNKTFRILKANTPGAVTFILPAASGLPAGFPVTKKSVGVRVPASPIARAIAEAIGSPIVSASLPLDEEELEALEGSEEEASLVWEFFGERVDLMIDGGNTPGLKTTVVDLTGDEPEIIREGAAEINL